MVGTHRSVDSKGKGHNDYHNIGLQDKLEKYLVTLDWKIKCLGANLVG